jgi:tetratricopeptide (TPR) repeat protein
LFLAVSGVCGCKKQKKDTKKKADSPFQAAAAALQRIGRTRDSAAVEKMCAGQKASTCQCVRPTAVLLLDRDLHKEARAVLDKAPAGCRLDALRAETLARAGKTAAAEKLAQAVLKKSVRAGHALYALAHVRYVRGDFTAAAVYAHKAAAHGRKRSAQLLIGLMAFKQGRYARAKNAFSIVTQLDPTDAQAVYNLALIAQKQNHYRAAREGYLKALRLNPRSVDARYNLVVLTQAAGARDEARHHFKKFAAMVTPTDPRLRSLAALLRRPAAKKKGPRHRTSRSRNRSRTKSRGAAKTPARFVE